MNYEAILTKLKEKRDDADANGNFGMIDVIDMDIRDVENWLAGGQQGDCQVDLSTYGIGSVEAAYLIGETSEIPESVDVESIAREEVERSQANLHSELKKVRQLIKKKDWREAVARARQLELFAKGEVKETVSELRFQAQTQLNTALEKALIRAKRERTKNNDKSAREHYHIALNLDPSNSHARLALQEMDGLIKAAVSKERYESLHQGLSDRRDIRRLGESIYDAEALEGEGKLPSRLIELLKQARKFYDESRRQMGEDTTAMRFGDVVARASAVARIQARVAGGWKTLYDNAIDSDRPAYYVLQEAQALLQQACEDTAQYEINNAEKFKTLHPRYVHQRLTKALQQPFYEQQKRTLEEKLAEVAYYVQAQKKAESMQSQAMQETDPVHKLDVLLQANQMFGAIAGLKEQIAQTRPVAISVMQAGIKDALQRTELFISSQEYSEARTTTNDVEIQFAKWPEPEIPEEMTRLLDKVKVLRQKIDATEKVWKEYTRLAADVRKKVADPDQRAAGLTLFKQISEDERFQIFHNFRTLTTEIDQYLSIGGYDDLVDTLLFRVGEIKFILNQIRTAEHQSPQRYKEVEQRLRLEIKELEDILRGEDDNDANL